MGRVFGKDERGPLQLAAQQAFHDRCDRGERRIGDHDKRPPWQSQVAGVGLHDLHGRAREPLAQERGTRGMELEGDDPGTGGDEVRGDGTRSRAYVEDEVAPTDAGTGDEPARPAVSELMPSPPDGRSGGHGAPSPWPCQTLASAVQRR